MSESQKPVYPAESVGSILTTNVLVAKAEDELEDLLRAIASADWDDIQYAYVLDSDRKLIGVVDLARFLRAKATKLAKDLMTPPSETIHPHADQEKAVLLAVKGDITAVPVVDSQGVFLGAVVARKIIDVMHQEHLEDALLSSGIRGRGSHITKLATSGYWEVITSRAPWLLFGGLVGLGLGLIASIFEKSLETSVALAYFVPVVAYVADSVGTQSEAIAVRALATFKINYTTYLLRELVVGLVLGAILGSIGAVGAALIGHSMAIGLIVGFSLFVASAVASVLASLIPIIFKTLGKDPALGSGPLATALQDVVSIIIYFLFAAWLL